MSSLRIFLTLVGPDREKKNSPLKIKNKTYFLPNKCVPVPSCQLVKKAKISKDARICALKKKKRALETFSTKVFFEQPTSNRIV